MSFLVNCKVIILELDIVQCTSNSIFYNIQEIYLIFTFIHQPAAAKSGAQHKYLDYVDYLGPKQVQLITMPSRDFETKVVQSKN